MIVQGCLGFVYLMGAWNMWEDVRDEPCSPSPDGAFYSLELEATYASHPELHGAMNFLFRATSVLLWPLVTCGGIIGLAWRGRLRIM